MAGAEHVILTRGLTKVWGRRRAVDGLELEVSRGEIFGFLGPNGAGKSTTIRMLLGLIAPTSGEAFLGGHSILRSRRQALRQVGAIVEAPCFHDHLTARKNLELAQRLHGRFEPARLEEVLDLVSLRARADDPVSIYSHGMRQRLGIARALLHRPQVVVLDEPADGLDPRGRREVRDIILDISRRLSITILLSSHLLNEMEVLCDRVGIIHQGRMLYRGTMDDLRARYAPERLAVRVEVDDADAAERLLAGAALAPDLSVRREDGTALRVEVTRDRARELGRMLTQGGVAVLGLTPLHESLEDLFLQLTPGSPT